MPGEIKRNKNKFGTFDLLTNDFRSSVLIISNTKALITFAFEISHIKFSKTCEQIPTKFL